MTVISNVCKVFPRRSIDSRFKDHRAKAIGAVAANNGNLYDWREDEKDGQDDL